MQSISRLYVVWTITHPTDYLFHTLQSRNVPWETYMTARLISDKDLSLIRRYDKRSDELRASMLEEVQSIRKCQDYLYEPVATLS